MLKEKDKTKQIFESLDFCENNSLFDGDRLTLGENGEIFYNAFNEKFKLIELLEALDTFKYNVKLVNILNEEKLKNILNQRFVLNCLLDREYLKKCLIGLEVNADVLLKNHLTKLKEKIDSIAKNELRHVLNQYFEELGECLKKYDSKIIEAKEEFKIKKLKIDHKDTFIYNYVFNEK